MSDLIERRAAIDAIEHITSSMSVCVNVDECHGMKRMQRQAVIELANLPSAQRWIPVSEGLPKTNGRYVVTRGLNACGALWNRVYIANYSDLMGINKARIWWKGNVGKPDFERLDDVLAWMPLPEPWKGEEDE